MKFQTILPIAVLLAIFYFAPACHHHSEEDDTVNPEITILSPTEAQAIQGAVQITVDVTDETSLHEVSVKVTKDSDVSTVFEAAPPAHDELLVQFAQTFTPSGISADTPMTLTVVAEDHAWHIVTKIVRFTAKL